MERNRITLSHFALNQTWEVINVRNGHIFAWRKPPVSGVEYAWCLRCGIQCVNDGKEEPCSGDMLENNTNANSKD